VSEQETEPQYQVVVNDEEQYSIWPQGRQIPAGWHDIQWLGSKDECLAHISSVWTDMRPLSLRVSMGEQAAL
jgi:MbtH protein